MNRERHRAGRGLKAERATKHLLSVNAARFIHASVSPSVSSPSCFSFISRPDSRGDDHLPMMDEIRRCFVTATSKHYNGDGSLDWERVLTWKRSDIHLLV